MRLFRLPLAASLLAIACGSSSSDSSYDIPKDALLTGSSFVPIYHAAPAGAADGSLRTLALHTQASSSADASSRANDSFYLAIHKRELGQKFFLSAFMKQFFPGAVTGGAARSLGTKVVSFKVQNGKLFVFDVDSRKQDSDTFNPDIVVESYPIVDFGGFSSLPGASDYVLFDPAAGLNRFNVVSDAYGAGATGERFDIELLFNQRFRPLTDGVAFEQIFTGYSMTPDPKSGDKGEENGLKGQGTMGIALRRYSEGKGFTNRKFPPKPYYFTSDLRLVPNTGETEVSPIKWNVYAGMKPIQWKISYRAKVTNDLEKYKAYDVVGALKHGIEDWNSVFGFKVFEAVLGTPDDSPSDDDKNMIYWDEDPSYGAAFANWRTNPNTGEIRGASVYMNIGWLEGGDGSFEDDVATPTTRTRNFSPLSLKARPKTAALTWYGMPDTTTCVLWGPQYMQPGEVGDDVMHGIGAGTEANAVPHTKKEKVEAYLRNTLLHEVGHTLGLRHNFKGSTEGNSSIMDYNQADEEFKSDLPGAYDIQAIKYLYGLSEDLPAKGFCTDDAVKTDPMCNQFDKGANPLDEYYLKNYQPVVNDFVTKKSAIAPNNTLNLVLQFVRAGKDSATRVDALTKAIARYKVLAPGATLPAGDDPARIDTLARNALKRLFLDDVSLRGNFTADPPASDAALIALLMPELRGNLLNSDGIRSWETRRAMVDILKKMQNNAALTILKDAQADLTTKRAALTGDDANAADDLLARIARATNPYFN